MKRRSFFVALAAPLLALVRRDKAKVASRWRFLVMTPTGQTFDAFTAKEGPIIRAVPPDEVVVGSLHFIHGNGWQE